MRLKTKIAIGVMTFVVILSVQATVITNVAQNTKERINDAGSIGDTYYIGEYYNTAPVDTMDRCFFIFALPDLAGEELVTATLRFNLTAITGSPSDADVYHMDSTPSSALSVDYYAASGTLMGSSVLTSGSTTGEWYEVDVTSGVLADYAATATYVGFRCQLADETKTEAVARYTIDLNATGGGGSPRLVLETIPEPATAMLLLFSGAGIIIFLRQRMR